MSDLFGFLGLVIVFVIIALVAGFLGFGLLAGVMGLIAKILFFVFLVLVLVWVLRFFMGRNRHMF
jgi:uncharacterized membrane protein YtjA (UPF0391 family)